MGLFNFCCDSRSYVIFLVGNKEDKKTFLKNVFNLEAKDVNFSEYEVSIGWSPAVIQMLDNDNDEVKEVYDMHMRSCNGVIRLSNDEEPISVTKDTLLVFMNGRPIQQSEGKLLVASVENNNYKDCKNKLKSLLKNINKEKSNK